jgi:hypothetical protein
MELTGVTDSSYATSSSPATARRAAYNGDGLQLSGTRVSVRDVVTTDNGSSALYEHGLYVSAAAATSASPACARRATPAWRSSSAAAGVLEGPCWWTTGSRSTAAPRTAPGGPCAHQPDRAEADRAEKGCVLSS